MIPFLLAALALTKATKTGIDIYGQRKQAKIYEQEGEMEAELYGKNAALAEEQASDAIARGREAEIRQRIKMRGLTGAQRTSFAGQGVLLGGEGSASQVVQSDQRVGEYDALMIRENAAREALGYTRQADIYQSQGELTRRSSKNRAKATRNQIYGSLANFGGDMFQLYKGRNG